ncbi:serine hydrolase domain-containing protein [Mucilaginibacter glaciei]|uniref:Beta-lactamase family protein n=1 Tax=Mucilaginibacter glaciei TaxID=2772109 RepID=A0A926S5A9_9SPHI|nr:serine hydrolase domain-containing protein [Mucilaginibacter glaciei]MBD1392576.1 beta-lactamase family protein [Mucilaginibacter glaciei]
MLIRLSTLVITLLTFTCAICLAQNKFNKVDEWLATNAPQMGGRVVLVVYQNGKTVYTGSQNNLSVKQKMVNRIIANRTGKPVSNAGFDADTRQPVASCSKWFSAALVMTFVDEGKLKLTDTVGKFLPVLSKSGKGGITIAQCLSHQTGIKSPELKESLRDMRDNNSMDEAITDIAALPIEGKPGTVFRYSNTGLQIAGAVIEKISGKTFQQLFADRITGPLNMASTDFNTGKVVLPAGGAVSTANDYLKFLVMILNKGTANGKRILSEESIRQMQVNRITAGVTVAHSPAGAAASGYGFGEWVMGNGSVSSPGLFGSYPVVNNDKKYAAFLMAYYIKNDGRGERYRQLNSLFDEAMQ